MRKVKINDRHGYFGGCLDSLDDCLNGNFWVLFLLMIRFTHFGIHYSDRQNPSPAGLFSSIFGYLVILDFNIALPNYFFTER